MSNRSKLSTALVLAVLASGCGTGAEDGEGMQEPRAALETAPQAGPTETDAAPQAGSLETETGEATFYADILDRQRTASGEPLDQGAMVAAHRRFPFGTILRVTNLENDREVRVRVIDRGPFGTSRTGEPRVIDLSRTAAEQLGFTDAGSTPVRVEVLEYGEGLPASS